MDTHALALLSASALTVGFGLVRLAVWILDHRAQAALRAHREQVLLIESVLEHGAPLNQRRAVISTAECELEFVQ
ncbi:hypothetical protein JH302_09695 [Xanthomonas campestris]|uniref:hypothetical protein n=1 Tax=Xanthomonas campestris TaxID=339 RepID=UPI00236796F0|nr:hypothetical protein [Xanthomonas campestris]WDJ58273.1 hypothetical protein JH257_11530 [Xanthomonas campestris pv. campestris]WDJ62478.1 hypothetical protein JH266_11530 [Xanthomonas campestris pv. campestris]WDJ66680.1 hypothetical protein JH278_11525 [Xanthomonas campestris pv. campestris]WDJ91533.1 hypothetical protein JH302_09695 [Xanthomonas campestris]